tara:strand:+ start:1562 stop:1888 length:327 start_codon:yes stop_codon:yes gene_type:complete
MTNKAVNIDLNKLTGRVFVGRSNGQAARKHFKLDSYNPKDNTLIFLVPDNTISINSSFFLGLFGRDVQQIGDFKAFFDYVDISRVDDRFKEQLQVAVKRSLGSSNYGL